MKGRRPSSPLPPQPRDHRADIDAERQDEHADDEHEQESVHHRVCSRIRIQSTCAEPRCARSRSNAAPPRWQRTGGVAAFDTGRNTLMMPMSALSAL